MKNIINIEQINYNPDELLNYNSLLNVLNLDPKAHTNRKRTITNKIKPYFIVEEIKNEKGNIKYYKIIGKIENPIEIKRGRPSISEFNKEKEYLLYCMMVESINKRKGMKQINRVQRGGTAIANDFGILNKVKINQFSKNSYEYKFIKQNYALLNILNKLIYGKKKNIFNFINNNVNIEMTKSLILMKDYKIEDIPPDFKRIDEYYGIDILDFDYNDLMNSYCGNRHIERIFEMQNEGYSEQKIDNFRKKKFTDYNIFNYRNEFEIFQDKADEYFLAHYENYKPIDYNFVCIRNLIIKENSEYNKIITENVTIDKELLYQYKTIINNDVINDLKKTFLIQKCNNKENDLYKQFIELLEICIRI